ncbi:peptide ABC transporter substrate-binding protein [Pasteurellaceae bacterium Macca]|nr:peptide ABC transporter substrate-binding protein [Pasteurellaceae bacterium Macca]
MIKVPLQAVVFFGFFALGLLPWGHAAPRIPIELKKDSLVYCTNIASFSFNPQKADASSQMNVITEQIYDKLIEFDPVTNRLKPALAERFEVSEDGLTITLHLRKNVAFHQTSWFTPTRPFNAEDVLFSLHRVMGDMRDLSLEKGQSDRLPQLANGHFPYFESIDFKGKIARLRAVNAHQVQIELTRPNREILSYLASQYSVMLSKEYALQLNADDNLRQLDVLPVGTGAYQLEQVVRNGFVRLTANPHYWGKSAKIKQVIVDFSTSGTGRMAKFLNGECDVSAFPEPSQLTMLPPQQGYIAENKGANLAYLAFNMQRQAVQSVEFRQKIAQGINRPRMASLFFYGVANVAENVLPQALFHQPNPVGYPYRPTVVTQSPPLNLWVIDERRIYNAHPLKMAEYVRSELARIGIEVVVRQVSRATLIEQLAKGEADYDLILSGWLGNNFDAESFLTPLLSCQSQQSVTNLAHWCDAEFENLLRLAREQENDAEKQVLYQQIQARLAQQMPLLPLVNVNRLLVANHQVEGVTISPFGQVKLADFRLKTQEK